MRAALLCIALVGLLMYAGSLDGTFIWDDDALVAGNTLIKSWSNVGKIFSSDQGAGFGPGVPYGFYRPFTALTFMLDYRLWGLNPWGYHLSAVLLHILAAAGAYLLARRLAGSQAALFTGLLFLSHPVHTETVSWIACRGDLLAAVGVFFGMYLYTKAVDGERPSWKLLSAAYACAAAALFSKECALVVPLYIIGYHFAFRKRLTWGCLAPFIALSAGYLCLRIFLLKGMMPPHSFADGVAFARIPGFLRALGIYLRLLVVPVHLHTEYGNLLYPWGDPSVLSGAALLCALLWCAFRSRARHPVVTFGILWFVAALVPVTSIYPRNAFYMAERWLYVPSFGLILGVSYFLSRSFHAVALRAAVCVVVALFSALVSMQVTRWSDPLAFYRWNMRFEPRSARMHNNVGVIYARGKRYQQALAAFQESVTLDPLDKSHIRNLAIGYRLAGDEQQSRCLADAYGFDLSGIPRDSYEKNTVSESH